MDCNSVFAQTESSEKNNITKQHYPNNTIMVSGNALAKIKPDLVTISLGVETTKLSANDAVASNSIIMNEIISSLKDKGIRENEIGTYQYAVNPNYNYSQTGDMLKINGFTVTNILKIQSMNLNDTSMWIDTAIAAGANTVNGVDYGISEQKLNSTKNQLIKDAIANAKQKASIASSAVGLNILGIRSIAIDTGESTPPQPFSTEFSAKSALSNTPSTPVIPGESDVSVLVHIVYSLG